MRSEIDLISQFDSCVKNALTKELKYRMRTNKNHRKHFVSLSELSCSQQSKLTYEDTYPSDLFRENLTTRLFEAVIHDELLYEALLSIKPKAREVIVLKFWGDMTDEQIGQALNINRRTVNHNKNRALLEMRKYIEEMRKHEK